MDHLQTIQNITSSIDKSTKAKVKANKLTSKKLLELGDMSTHSDVKLAALLRDLVGVGLFCSFICLYRSVTWKRENGN